MNISEIYVDGVKVDMLSKDDLLNPRKVISFINGDIPGNTFIPVEVNKENTHWKNK